MILDQILQRTKEDLEDRRHRVPVSCLPPRSGAPPDGRFLAALQGPGLSVIAEIKRASPSAGRIRPDFDVSSLARAYREAGVAAISCLTDGPFFQGSLEHLREARAAVDTPLLRKDFVIDEYQLDEAIAYGADAVLLIVAALEPRALLRLRTAAVDRGLDVLVESHTAAEARVAVDCGCRILGINNRDLQTFTVNLETTRLVVESLGDPRPVIVSESGIRSREDLERVRSWGADAVLVGERFMREEDVARAATEFVAAGRVL